MYFIRLYLIDYQLSHPLNVENNSLKNEMCEESGTLLPSESELASTDHDVKKSQKTRYILK